MASQNWIPLFEYSSKYNISLSTLRRRIKNNAILFKLDGGKYFILDGDEIGAPMSYAPAHVPLQHMKTQSSTYAAPLPISASHSDNYIEASVLTSANRLVEELKSAYAKILQEKEEQIGILKEQILDLNMLVNLLEKQSDQYVAQKAADEKKAQSLSSSEQNIDNFYFPEIDN